jgi:hypothetical protein
MAREPASPGPSGERFGPLTLARVGKEDGRALILYSHEQREHHEREHQEQGERVEGRERA